MTPANPASAQKDGASLKTTTPTTNWLRDWKGFPDFTLQFKGFRGSVDVSDGKKDCSDDIAACDTLEAAQLQRSPSVSSTSPHKGKRSPAEALLKLIQKNDVKSPVSNENNSFLNTPMEIKLMIMEHLDPLDHIMLRFTCKELYQNLPLDFRFPFPQHSCGKARLFMRLMNSSLLPDFFRRDRFLTKREIKATLRSFYDLLYCDMCQNYWFTNCVIQCPFHFQMNTEPKHTILQLIRSRVGFHALIQHMSISKVITQEGYIDFVERAIASAPITSFRVFQFQFVDSWAHQINEWEDSGLHKGEEGKRQIWTLHCCNHCKNVLPSNSYRFKCNYCRCEFCGWTAIHVLRVGGIRDGEPRFCPLGILREGTKKKTLKMLKGRKLKDKGPSNEYMF